MLGLLHKIYRMLFPRAARAVLPKSRNPGHRDDEPPAPALVGARLIPRGPGPKSGAVRLSEPHSRQ